MENMNIELAVLIREKLRLLSGGNKGISTGFSDDDDIPGAGILESAQVLELIVWLEEHFGISLGDDDLTVDNLGTINRIAIFVARKKAANPI